MALSGIALKSPMVQLDITVYGWPRSTLTVFLSGVVLRKCEIPAPALLNGRMAMTDPVCGMTVDPATAKATAEYAGTMYYFCCAGCATKFRANPDQYLKPKSCGPALITIGAPKSACNSHVLTPRPTAHVSCKLEKIRRPSLRLPHVSQSPRIETRAVPHLRHGTRPRNASRADQNRIHLPHAPGNRTRRAGNLPHLRHGARAAHRRGDRRRIPNCGRCHGASGSALF